MKKKGKFDFDRPSSKVKRELRKKQNALLLRPRRGCCCGHAKKDHRQYVGGGHNTKGSRYVCTKDGCTMWAYCNL